MRFTEMDRNIHFMVQRVEPCVTIKTSLISRKIEDEEKSFINSPTRRKLFFTPRPPNVSFFVYAMNKSHHEVKVKNVRSITPTEPSSFSLFPHRPPTFSRATHKNTAVIHSAVSSRHTSSLWKFSPFKTIELERRKSIFIPGPYFHFCASAGTWTKNLSVAFIGFDSSTFSLLTP